MQPTRTLITEMAVQFIDQLTIITNISFVIVTDNSMQPQQQSLPFLLYVHVSEKLEAEQINKLAIVESRFQSFHISQGQRKSGRRSGRGLLFYSTNDRFPPRTEST